MRREIASLRDRNARLLRRAMDAEKWDNAIERGDSNSPPARDEIAPTDGGPGEGLWIRDHLMRAIFERALEPVVITDRRARYVDANPAACQLYGVPLEQLVGRRIAEFAGAEVASDTNYENFRHQGFARGTFSLPRPDGTRIILEYGSVYDVQPGLDLSVMRDITQRASKVAPITELELIADTVAAWKLARTLTARGHIDSARQSDDNDLAHARKMEGIVGLARGIVHNYNNLLLVIVSYARLAFDALMPGDPVREDLGEIQRAANRATEITRHLFEFSGPNLLHPRPLDLTRVVAEMEPALRRLVGPGIGLMLILEPRVCPVLADRGQLEQVVTNVVTNAQQAMPAGGKLTIETANLDLDASYASTHSGVEPGPYVMLAIGDTGIGMDARVQQRVFEPFFTTRIDGKGTGLGLATVFGIVQQAGGHVSLHSQPGRGARFEIYFPRTASGPDGR